MGKYIDIENVADVLEELSSARDRVVFTNGCFDILHPGHIRYLAAARALGDRLVVGVNDDDSVRRLKGPKRPINTLRYRMEMLAALSSVDIVIPFAEDTPKALISSIRPSILVKGGDYQASEVVGAELVKSYGGKVIICPFEGDYSTTAFIRKIKSL